MQPATAHAGAWIAPEGGQEIWSNAFGQRDGLNFYESSGYWELPLDDDLSLAASSWVEQNYDTPEGWRGDATVGVKHALFLSERAAISVQAGALWDSTPAPGCSEGGVELRGLAGRSIGERAFLNVEAAGRGLEGQCWSARLDLAAGYRPDQHWMVLGEVFFEGEAEQKVAKLQLSLVRFGDEDRGVQLGVRGRIDGQDPEPAMVIAFWGRPGD